MFKQILKESFGIYTIYTKFVKVPCRITEVQPTQKCTYHSRLMYKSMLNPQVNVPKQSNSSWGEFYWGFKTPPPSTLPSKPFSKT